MNLIPALPMHLLNADGSDCQPNCPRCSFDRQQAGQSAFLACADLLATQRIRSVNCPCGTTVSLPKIAGMPMTFVCFCEREYDHEGNLLTPEKPETYCRKHDLFDCPYCDGGAL
jgi:hypothetical protein